MRRAVGRRGQGPEEGIPMSINYNERIPNNVSLSEDKQLQRALERWQPKYLDWWREMGPEGFQSKDF